MTARTEAAAVAPSGALVLEWPCLATVGRERAGHVRTSRRLGAWVRVCLVWLALLSWSGCSEQADAARAPRGTKGASTIEAPLLSAVNPAAEAGPGAGSSDAAAPSPFGERDSFMGDGPDGPIREVLRSAPIVAVEKGRGGRSLGFKITLQGGQKAYYKPEQTFSAANWFAEVAAFHLDRMLGIGRVPCVVSRQIPWEALEAAAGKDPRVKELIITDGMTRGAFVAWVSGGLTPLPETQGWERWVRVKYWPTTAVSPFQRPAVWRQQLLTQKRLGSEFRSKTLRQKLRTLNPEPDRDDRPAELSDLIVFDYLIKNGDRWGGANVNVLTRGTGGPLIFLDNGAGFEPGDARPSLMEARLHTLQRFRRSTIRALRGLDLARYRARLGSEPVQPVLSEYQLQGLEERRGAVLDWVDEMQRTHGEAIWGWE
jgi:Golgi casein kinase, C-terminal, Fam20